MKDKLLGEYKEKRGKRGNAAEKERNLRREMMYLKKRIVGQKSEDNLKGNERKTRNEKENG